MYYTTRTFAVGIAIIPREPVRFEELLYHENQGIWMVGAVTQTCSVCEPRAMHFFFIFSVFIDEINSY